MVGWGGEFWGMAGGWQGDGRALGWGMDTEQDGRCEVGDVPSLLDGNGMD